MCRALEGSSILQWNTSSSCRNVLFLHCKRLCRLGSSLGRVPVNQTTAPEVEIVRFQHRIINDDVTSRAQFGSRQRTRVKRYQREQSIRLGKWYIFICVNGLRWNRNNSQFRLNRVFEAIFNDVDNMFDALVGLFQDKSSSSSINCMPKCDLVQP